MPSLKQRNYGLRLKSFKLFLQSSNRKATVARGDSKNTEKQHFLALYLYHVWKSREGGRGPPSDAHAIEVDRKYKDRTILRSLHSRHVMLHDDVTC